MTAAEGSRSAWLLLDTHTLLWMVEDHPRLGAETAKTLNRAAREDRIAVGAITPWEIALLVSKKRIDLQRDPLEWVRATLSLPGVHLVPLEPEIAVASTRLPFEMHADPADRIIVATARHLGATLVTADRALLELAKKGNFRGMDAGA
ncbi:MAG: type II toxin-antitoxin system VapC family toxin [Terracidiphilus sp.]